MWWQGTKKIILRREWIGSFLGGVILNFISIRNFELKVNSFLKWILHRGDQKTSDLIRVHFSNFWSWIKINMKRFFDFHHLKKKKINILFILKCIENYFSRLFHSFFFFIISGKKRGVESSENLTKLNYICFSLQIKSNLTKHIQTFKFLLKINFTLFISW